MNSLKENGIKFEFQRLFDLKKSIEQRRKINEEDVARRHNIAPEFLLRWIEFCKKNPKVEKFL